MLVTLMPQLTTHTVLMMPVALHLRAICHLLVITDGIANGAACYHRCFRADVSPALISGRTVFPCVSKIGFCVPREISQRFSPGSPEIKPGGIYLLFPLVNGFQRFSFCDAKRFSGAKGKSLRGFPFRVLRPELFWDSTLGHLPGHGQERTRTGPGQGQDRVRTGSGQDQNKVRTG